jgi:hypothetical protein
MQTRTKPKTDDAREIKSVLQLLSRLAKAGKISVRLGPIKDVKAWVNNFEELEKRKIVAVEAASVQLSQDGLQIGLGLDHYAS